MSDFFYVSQCILSILLTDKHFMSKHTGVCKILPFYFKKDSYAKNDFRNGWFQDIAKNPCLRGAIVLKFCQNVANRKILKVTKFHVHGACRFGNIKKIPTGGQFCPPPSIIGLRLISTCADLECFWLDFFYSGMHINSKKIQSGTICSKSASGNQTLKVKRKSSIYHSPNSAFKVLGEEN